jgi:TRAP-type C4-dicarboxylate transport system substrate-binding protein
MRSFRQANSTIRVSIFALPDSLFRTLLCLGLSLLAGVGTVAADKPLNLKLSTLAPVGSTYHRSLQAMAEKWRTDSNGRLRLTIFAGGAQGSESDAVGLMQVGSLDAALLTAVGLADIDRSVTALQNMPMVFRSLEELDYTVARMSPVLEKKLLDKGYIVLFWTDSGWIRFFTKTRVLVPDDLRKLKIFSWTADTRQYDLWKSSGFNPVALETSAIPGALLSGTISAVSTPPVFANFLRLNEQAKFMLELNWCPLVGAAVVRKDSWARIPEEIRKDILKTAAEARDKIKAEGRKESADAVTAMTARGLTVTKVTPEIEQLYRNEVDKVRDQIRGNMVPEDLYDQVQEILKEYRAKGAKAE